jgi:hypothetical protein
MMLGLTFSIKKNNLRHKKTVLNYCIILRRFWAIIGSAVCHFGIIDTSLYSVRMQCAVDYPLADYPICGLSVQIVSC